VDDPHELRPPRPGPRMDFLTVKSTQPVKLLVLSRRIWAHYIHWVGDFTQPCTAEKGGCEHCTPQNGRRWKGYLHVLQYDLHWKPAFVCLTPGCGWEMLEGTDADYDFRGKMLKMWRSGKSPTSLLSFTWDEHYKPHFELPQELDPKPFLDTVFKRKSGKKKNPLT
jgi:hypothetical protein